MERRMEIVVEIGGYGQERKEDIARALMVEWGFRTEDFYQDKAGCGGKKILRAAALGTMSEGEDKAEIVQRIERAVWRANGGRCHVAVGTREIDPDPFQPGVLNDEEYERQIA